MIEKTYKIEGMNCQHCVKAVTIELEGIGVDSFEVEIGFATVIFDEDKMRFKREFGILNENGDFTQDIPTLLSYGLLPSRVSEKGVKMPPHSNNFCIRKDLFWEMGGYREDRIGQPYPQGEDAWFKRTWTKFLNRGMVKESEYRPTLYMFPNGHFCGNVDYNPFNLFHNLSRESERNARFIGDSAQSQ